MQSSGRQTEGSHIGGHRAVEVELLGAGDTQLQEDASQRILASRRQVKVPTFRIPLGYLYQRTIREAAIRGVDPNALALAVVNDACGLRNTVPGGGVDLVLGDRIHPRSPLMIVSGPLVDAVRAAAKKHGTCATRFITWRLGLALEERYQRSVSVDLI